MGAILNVMFRMVGFVKMELRLRLTLVEELLGQSAYMIVSVMSQD